MIKSTLKERRKSKHNAEVTQRLEEIARARCVEGMHIVPIELCELPDWELRTRFSTVNPAHVQVMKESVLKDPRKNSEWSVVVFGVAPNQFKLENYLGRGKVLPVILNILVLFCRIGSASLGCKARTLPGRGTFKTTFVPQQPVQNFLLQRTQQRGSWYVGFTLSLFR